MVSEQVRQRNVKEMSKKVYDCCCWMYRGLVLIFSLVLGLLLKSFPTKKRSDFSIFFFHKKSLAFSAAEWKCDDFELQWISSNCSMGDFCVDIQRIGDRHGNGRIQNPIWCILCDACRCFETCPPTTKWNIDIPRFGHTIIGIIEHLVPGITIRKKNQYMTDLFKYLYLDTFYKSILKVSIARFIFW